MDERSLLLDGLAGIAYQYSPDKPFRLASDKMSAEYLDCKLALSHAEIIAALGPVFRNRLLPNVVAIGGLTMGADALVMSATYFSATAGPPIRWFLVRKDPKDHGQRKLIEGDVRQGEHVAIVDDVVTSGESTIKAIRAARESGLVVAQVIVLVDREEQDGMANIRATCGGEVRVESVFTKTDIRKQWETHHRRTHETFQATA